MLHFCDKVSMIYSYFDLVVGRDLEKDITSETSGDFQRILVAILQAQRNEDPRVDHTQVELDADALYKSGEG